MCLTNRQSNISQARHGKSKGLSSQRKLRCHPTASGDPVACLEVPSAPAQMVGDPRHGDQRVAHHITTMALADGLVVDIGRGLGLP